MVIQYFSLGGNFFLEVVVVVQLPWRCRAMAGARLNVYRVDRSYGLLESIVLIWLCPNSWLQSPGSSMFPLLEKRFITVDASTSRKCRCRMVVFALRM